MYTRIRGLPTIALLIGSLGSGCTLTSESTLEQAAIACGDGPTVKGMDVSYYEDSIDWAAAHDAGIEFAIIRATDGLQYIDPKFPGYWAGAKAAGVIRGAYQFFRPAQDPIAQADLLLAKIGELEAGDLPPVIDVEVASGLTPAQVEASVRAWVDHVAAAIGRPPVIYAGLYSWHDLTASADLTSSPLWVAQYTSAACPNIPAPWTRWAFWQHTATGSIAGIPGANLDLDIFNGTIDQLRAFALADRTPSTTAVANDDNAEVQPDDGGGGGCSTSNGRGGRPTAVIGLGCVLAACLRRRRHARIARCPMTRTTRRR